MKQRVTISISSPILRHVDRQAKTRGSSRSQVIESFIQDAQRRKKEQELGLLAKEFFSSPESEEEAQERQDWLRMSLETAKHDR